MSKKPRKSAVAYYRKLYLAYLIETQPHNIKSLVQQTQMPEPTIKTSLNGLSDIGIIHSFVQTDGARNMHGNYQIDDWGDHKKVWVKENLQYVVDILQ